MKAFYNEIDPAAAAWLRELIAGGHIATGIVDERDIRDIRPDELADFTQCHFFAGIGGWSLALRFAGWPDDRPVWTGSCPCQPFSAAGKRGGTADERHLWPFWHYLIAECRPERVFGEQVASKDGLGWLDLVRADLEGAGYAVGAADLCAAGVGAPHIRQRLWFGAERVADGDDAFGRAVGQHREDGRDRSDSGRQEAHGVAGARGQVHGLADTDGRNAAAKREQRGGEQRLQPQGSGVVGLADAERIGREVAIFDTGGFGQTAGQRKADVARGSGASDRPRPVDGFWRDADWLYCRDGKWRPVEPGLKPLVNGLSGRVGLLRGYGNAIVPEVAAEFIQAFEEARADAERVRLMSGMAEDVFA